MREIVLVTGGFDPIHSGHINYFNAAKKLAPNAKLIVGLNSDKWLERKKGKAFMPFNERRIIIENLQMVDQVLDFKDDDGSACDAIYKLIKKHRMITFANGGDRVEENSPEFQTYGKTPWVRFVFGVGGINKMNSSSWILNDWKTNEVDTRNH